MGQALSAEQIGLVRSTFGQIAPMQDKVAALFYGRLFAQRPGLRPLFTGSLEHQGRKLMGAIAAVIASLDRLDAVVPTLKDLGQRHAGYGVQDADYVDVGDALLWTLEAGLGSAFGAEVRSAWAAAYTVVADTMKAGAADSPAQHDGLQRQAS
jgi:hemoglobin-like flavoprotein